jgi:predicted glutamine amidotransferase
MCRWISYSGSPIPLDELILKAEISMIDQSMSSRLTAKPTNGDGFGVGWYSRGEPGVYRSVQPAWNDSNLHDLAHHIVSPLFMAHVRRSTGTPVQQSNCHPYRHERWLFVHNGSLRDFKRMKRKLVLAIDPALYPFIQGSTDSETMFYLALTFGLDQEPIPALERMAGYIEQIAREQRIENPVQMTLGVADGSRLYAVRYSSEGNSRSLFHSASLAALKELYPTHPHLAAFPDDACAVVSEPLSELSDVWIAIPESTVLVVDGGQIESRPFEPQLP